ncbi:Hypothetical predicted protein [Octopus vulgaris]|nr:Hypothetical predicted protein [Octopus vulgaris]
MKLFHKYSQVLCFGIAAKHFGRKHHNLAGVLFLFFVLWLLLQVNVTSIVDFARKSQYSGQNKGFGYDGNGDAILSLLKQNVSACDGSFVGYGNELAFFKNIVLNPFKNAEFVQETADKQWTAPKKIVFSDGYFSVKCKKKPSYEFRGNNHLNKWFSVTRFQPDISKTAKIEPRLTIAVERYEYANLFHSMTDFYNAFLMMKIFNSTPAETNILLLDYHPKGLLISIWDQLFNNVIFAKDIKEPTTYNNLVWSIMGYNSPLYPCGKTPMLSQIAFIPYSRL